MAKQAFYCLTAKGFEYDDTTKKVVPYGWENDLDAVSELVAAAPVKYSLEKKINSELAMAQLQYIDEYLQANPDQAEELLETAFAFVNFYHWPEEVSPGSRFEHQKAILGKMVEFNPEGAVSFVRARLKTDNRVKTRYHNLCPPPAQMCFILETAFKSDPDLLDQDNFKLAYSLGIDKEENVTRTAYSMLDTIARMRPDFAKDLINTSKTKDFLDEVKIISRYVSDKPYKTEHADIVLNTALYDIDPNAFGPDERRDLIFAWNNSKYSYPKQAGERVQEIFSKHNAPLPA